MDVAPPHRRELFSKTRREELALGPANKRGVKPSGATARITVTVRKRPLLLDDEDRDIIDVHDKQNLTLNEQRRELSGADKITCHRFKFDRVYDAELDNQFIYHSCVRKLVDTVFEEGTNCSCFAFGQTGSGKTYTMMGAKRQGMKGLWEWAAEDIFGWMAQPEFKDCGLFVSFFEIHCNKAYDLLNSRKPVRPLEHSDGSVVVKNLTHKHVCSVMEIMTLIECGNQVRSTGRNSRNNESSRSHAILSIEVRQLVEIAKGQGRLARLESSMHTRAGASVTQSYTTNPTGSGVGFGTTSVSTSTMGPSFGKIAFIDLAGSERGADTVHFGRPAQQDGAGINKSLLALKECIRAMDQGKGHIPFRDSELTKVLRDFFTNTNGLCLMIATVSAANSCFEQTINTLRYAQRFIAVRENAQPCIVEDGDENDPIHDDLQDLRSADALMTRFEEPRPHDTASQMGDPVPASIARPRRPRIPSPPDSSRESSQGSEEEQPTCESAPSRDPSDDEDLPESTQYVKMLSRELDTDIAELLDETLDERAAEVLNELIGHSKNPSEEMMLSHHVERLSDREFRIMKEESCATVWNSYRDLLNHQNVWLRDVCQLIQAHVRVGRHMDSDLEKSRPSVNNPATLVAKTASINPYSLRMSRMFLEREVGALVKLARELKSVEAALRKTNQLEAEEKKRCVRGVHMYEGSQNEF